MDKIRIECFRAPENLIACAEFMEQHHALIKNLGIDPVSTSDQSWINDERVVLVVAFNADKMVAGMRLHCRYPTDTFDLPIIKAVGEQEPSLNDYVDDLSKAGVAECCGMWNSREFAGKRVTTLLGIAGFSLMEKLQIANTLGLIAKYTLSQSLRVGYLIEEQFGEEGYFQYPKPGFYGIVIRANESSIQRSAKNNWAERVASLKKLPKQSFTEKTDTSLIEVDYDLSVSDLNMEGLRNELGH